MDMSVYWVVLYTGVPLRSVNEVFDAKYFGESKPVKG